MYCKKHCLLYYFDNAQKYLKLTSITLLYNSQQLIPLTGKKLNTLLHFITLTGLFKKKLPLLVFTLVTQFKTFLK